MRTWTSFLSVRRLTTSLGLTALLAITACDDSGGGPQGSTSTAGTTGAHGGSQSSGTQDSRAAKTEGGSSGASQVGGSSGSGGQGSTGGVSSSSTTGGVSSSSATGGVSTATSSASANDTNAKTSSGGSSARDADGAAGTGGKGAPDAGTSSDGPGPDGISGRTTNPDSAAVSCYQEGLAAITLDLLKADITTLASASYEGRKTGTAGERKTVDYIVGQFKAAGLDGVAGKYEQAFKVSNTSGLNTVAVLAGNDPGVKDEVIMVGAHHDHLGKTTTAYYPGADDNASGTSAVMALGRAFAKCKGQLRRTLVFMTYGGEEQGLYGSYYYTQIPLFPIAKTMYMVNHDMIGYVAKNKLEVTWGTAFAKDTLTAACKKVSFCMLAQSDMRNEQGTDSDTFAAVRVPYTGFYSGEHDCYHKTCDTVDKLDMAGVTDTTKMSFDLIYALASTNQGLLKSANHDIGLVIDRSQRPFRDHRRAPAAP